MIRVAGECPHGREVISLLCSLVVDSQGEKLTIEGYKPLGFDDDLVFTVQGKLISSIQRALKVVRDGLKPSLN